MNQISSLRNHQAGSRILTQTGIIAFLLIALHWRPILVFVFVLLGTAVWSYVQKRTIVFILIVSLFVRIALIITDEWFGFFPIPPISPYHNAHSVAVVEAWSRGEAVAGLTAIDRMSHFIAYLYAPFYLVLGKGIITGRIATALFSLGIGYGTYRITEEITTTRTAYIASAVALFWPSILYRSLVFQREVIIASALLGIVYIGIRWVKEVTIRSVLYVVVLGILVGFLRPENLVLIAAILGSAFFGRGLRSPRYLLATLITTIPIFILFLTNLTAFTGMKGVVSPTIIDNFAYQRAHGDATYLVGLHYQSWFDVVLYTPLKVVYLLFSPLPWQIDGLVDLLAGMSGWLLLPVGIFARQGIAILREQRGVLLVLATYFVLGVSVYAIIEMNYGAAFRRRIQFIPILIILAAVSISRIKITIGNREEITKCE